MKIHKKSILISIIIVFAWTLAFFAIRHWYIHSIKIPARAKALSPIAEFNNGDRVDAIAFSPTNPNLIAVAGMKDQIKI